ncbi:alpha/beta hydrolase [Falsiroseomonas selenitidurans]|uniref:Alpha/beta hydrolase n=1 Tax=Falsiroseomonas selenitidurans TaxID=2716335 RepID=A0ABX1E3Q4_9PROT|nr:alpha/beta fold hydrolase [Falsiroseomonas selenitidurans]NKC31819.1 alpha/beta hydrolase [Falsiroseomonas selenitidurans]
MLRRHLLAAPALVAATAALPAPARAQAAIVTEEFSVPSAEGVEVFLRNKRPEGATTGPSRTLLMVHGAGFGASTTFDLPFAGLSWMDYIAGRGFDVWTLDIRGFGRATRPPALSQPADQNPPVARGAEAMVDLAAAVAFIRQQRSLEKLVLLGHSWGTKLVGRFAAEQPGQVERLVLYAPPWLREGPSRTDPGGGPLGAWRPLVQRAVRDSILSQAPEGKRAGLIPPGWFEHFAGVTWALDPVGIRSSPSQLRVPNGPVADGREFWNAGKPWWAPAQVTAPSLVVLGEWDRTTPPALGFAVFEALSQSPGKRMVVLAEGTHNMWMERNRGALFQAVQVFLEEAAG